MAIEHFDVFVIGTGNAGKHVAYDAVEAGLKVAIADNREFGGTCANRGCDPKKVLVGITEVLERSRDLSGKGIDDLPKVNWGDLMKFKETFTSAVPFTTERKLKDAGIKLYHQSPKFIDAQTLSVEGKTVTADKIVIATGNIPLELKIPGREYAHISDDFLELKELPESMIFIGAGYIGMEFAHIAARCGVDVTIVDVNDGILSNFDSQLAKYLQENSEQIGIKFVFNARATAIEKLRKNYRVTLDQGEESIELKAEMVFNTAGRVPAIADLELENGNVAFSKKGIEVNEYLQSTTNVNVYACGDVSDTSTLALTPIAHQEARVVAKNIVKGENYLKLDVPPTPSVVFTQPQLATVGFNEKEAREQGYDIVVREENVPTWYNSKRMNQNCYAFKTIVDKETGYILGAHLLSWDAAETINMFVMAMCGKLDVNTLKEMVFTYPSWSNDIKSMI
ncbi:dihydrolipoyl dehydrogenase family protein [Leeuwenhoekiella sp. W20_SRS_FM14]|uniref:dihydrolipoyl dehydrogenase family protein n=1 Tax=Leeuwenhoekiella sp. W20_SRS_FM14 TaxID=3240270 RepID=UPI003F97D4C6